MSVARQLHSAQTLGPNLKAIQPHVPHESPSRFYNRGKDTARSSSQTRTSRQALPSNTVKEQRRHDVDSVPGPATDPAVEQLARSANGATESSGHAEQLTPAEFRLPTGMAVQWLGTSSGGPTKTRNVSTVALRTSKHTYIVDAGEGASRQTFCGGIPGESISNIFITHLHGDHCFGLAGLLLYISDARSRDLKDKRPVRIFGPPGLQKLMEAALRLSASYYVMPLIVTEFTLDPRRARPEKPAPGLSDVRFAILAPEDTETARAALKRCNFPLRWGEVVPGLTWAMPCEDGMTVRSAQLRHRLECWGYVFQEASLPPTEKEDVVQRVGLKPGEALSQLTRSSSPSDTVQCKSEQPITFKDILNPPVVGRKVVLLGDTCDSTAIEGIARDADLVSHEATFSKQMEEKAWKSQHSTAAMAGNFARKIQARLLVLTHFSSRYSHMNQGGKPELEAQDASDKDIWGVVQEAKQAFGSPYIIPAQDFFTMDVYPRSQAAEMQRAFKESWDRATALERARSRTQGERPGGRSDIRAPERKQGRTPFQQGRQSQQRSFNRRDDGARNDRSRRGSAEERVRAPRQNNGEPQDQSRFQRPKDRDFRGRNEHEGGPNFDNSGTRQRVVYEELDF